MHENQSICLISGRNRRKRHFWGTRAFVLRAEVLLTDASTVCLKLRPGPGPGQLFHASSPAAVRPSISFPSRQCWRLGESAHIGIGNDYTHTYMYIHVCRAYSHIHDTHAYYTHIHIHIAHICSTCMCQCDGMYIPTHMCAHMPIRVFVSIDRSIHRPILFSD